MAHVHGSMGGMNQSHAPKGFVIGDPRSSFACVWSVKIGTTIFPAVKESA
jgi:hypothetical protein